MGLCSARACAHNGAHKIIGNTQEDGWRPARSPATMAYLRGPVSRRPRGFTLLELLVVIVIIGLISGLVLPRYFDTVGKSKTKIARAQIAALEKALDQYRLDVGSYPSTEQGLQALMAQPAGVPGWQGPYLKKAVPPDPWNHPYIYKRLPSLKDIDLVSLGADGKPGGDGEARDVSLADKE